MSQRDDIPDALVVLCISARDRHVDENASALNSILGGDFRRLDIKDERLDRSAERSPRRRYPQNARLLDEDAELLQAIVSNDDNLSYGSIIRVYTRPDEAITSLTRDGIEELEQMLTPCSPHHRRMERLPRRLRR